MFAPSVLHHGDGHWPRPGQSPLRSGPAKRFLACLGVALAPPAAAMVVQCPLPIRTPSFSVGGAVLFPFVLPLPSFRSGRGNLGIGKKRQCRRAVDPIPSPSSTTTSPLRTSPPWVLSSLRFLLSCHARGPRATKTTNPDARRLALREELTFPSSSLASVAGSSEPGLLLSSTSDRRQRPRSTPTSLRVAPRIVLGTLHRTTAPFRKGRRRSFNLNLIHNHHIHLAQVHEPP